MFLIQWTWNSLPAVNVVIISSGPSSESSESHSVNFNVYLTAKKKVKLNKEWLIWTNYKLIFFLQTKSTKEKTQTPKPLLTTQTSNITESILTHIPIYTAHTPTKNSTNICSTR